MPIVSRKYLSELCGDIVQSVNKWIERGKIIHLDGNKKLIDTENPVNALFIQQRQEVHAQKKLLGEVVKPVVISKKEQKNSIKNEKITVSAEKVTKIPKKVTKAELVEPVKKRPGQPKKVTDGVSGSSGAKAHKTFHVAPKVTQSVKRAEAQRMNDQNLRAILKVDQEAKIRQQNIDLTELRIQSEKIRLDKTAGNLLPIDLGMGVIERCVNSVLKTFEKDFERIGDIYANFAGLDPTSRTDFIKECRVALSISVENAGKSAEAEIDILVDNYAETLMIGQKKA